MTKTAIDELREFNQWVAYKLVPSKDRPGKTDKIPINPATGKRASTTGPRTWSYYEAAEKAAKHYRLPGTGFVFTELAGIVGIDLDNCIDDQGNLSPFAAGIVDAINSYTEVSPSGRGLHLFARAKLPEGHRCREDGRGFEIYTQDRFFTVTGKHWPGSPQVIKDQQEAVEAVYRFVFGEPAPASSRPAQPARPVDLADVDLIERAKSARNGDKFTALWNGDTSHHNGDDSAADMALIRDLAFWAAGDAQRIDQLFRQSGLMRPKWDEKRGQQTYGQRTIDKALATVTEFYQAGRQNGHNPAPAAELSGELSSTGQDNPAPAFRRYSVTEFLQRPKKKWLIDNLLGEQDMVMIFGEAGTGKTFAALALAFSAALGRRFACKFEATRPLKVAYCAGEGQNGLVNRLTAATTAFDGWQGDNQALLDQNLSIYADAPQLFNSDVQQSIYNFVTEWQAGQAGPLDLLIVDTLHSATYGADENNAKDAGLIIQAAKYAVQALGCAVVLVHHANRAGKYRGSSAFHGAMDGMIETKYDKETKIGQVEAFKLKDADLFSTLYFKLAYDPAAESCAVEWLDREVIKFETAPKTAKTKDEIVELLRSGEFNQSQIVTKLTEVERKTVLKALEELVEEGLVLVKQGPRNSKIYQLAMEL